MTSGNSAEPILQLPIQGVHSTPSSFTPNAIANKTRGFTLLELLVVIVIIAILVAVLIPAVQYARESARKTMCRNNLKQIALAVNGYLTSVGVYPPSATIPSAGYAGANGSWSVHGRILPHVDQSATYEQVDLSLPYTDPKNAPVIDNLKISLFVCPSDQRESKPRSTGFGNVYGTNYGFNYGTWFVYNPSTGISGDGPFLPNTRFFPQNIIDGTSNTLMLAEVKQYTGYSRNNGPASTTIPPDVQTVVTECIDASADQQWDFVDADKNSGHTVWTDGRVAQTGFTTVFPPNTKVLHEPPGSADENKLFIDLDYVSWQEGLKDGASSGRPTYAAVTSRSFHAGIVNVAMLAGNVRSISDGIDTKLWRALGTRKAAAGEIEPGDF